MVAWTILCIFIGMAVSVDSANPTTRSFHFSTCNYFAQEIRRGEVRPYLMVWPYHERLFQQYYRPLSSKNFGLF
jgi:hypothetical protein